MKLECYAIFNKFKSGKLKKQLPVGISYNYESAFVDKDLDPLTIVGISGSDLYCNKSLAQKDAKELNRLWEGDFFVVKKINLEVKGE